MKKTVNRADYDIEESTPRKKLTSPSSMAADGEKRINGTKGVEIPVEIVSSVKINGVTDATKRTAAAKKTSARGNADAETPSASSKIANGSSSSASSKTTAADATPMSPEQIRQSLSNATKALASSIAQHNLDVDDDLGSLKYQPQFTITDTHDDEHIFDAEMEIINKLKKEIRSIALWSNKAVAFFLCARNHNADEAAKLIKQYVANLKEHGFHRAFPKVTDPELEFCYENELCFIPKQSVDKHGRLVMYIHLDRFRPTSERNLMASYFWLVAAVLHAFPLSVLRRGVVAVFDSKNLDLQQSFDLSEDIRSFTQKLEVGFPLRFQSLLLVNATTANKDLLKQWAHATLPQSLATRIRLTTPNKLQSLIPNEFLPASYGGLLNVDGELIRKSMRLRNRLLHPKRTAAPSSGAARAKSTPAEHEQAEIEHSSLTSIEKNHSRHLNALEKQVVRADAQVQALLSSVNEQQAVVTNKHNRRRAWLLVLFCLLGVAMGIFIKRYY